MTNGSAAKRAAPVKRSRRPRTDPERARETVLDAAEELLREHGPGALRLGEIAARAGLSHSNVLYHFDGMRDLEAQLGRRVAFRLAEEIADVHRKHRDAPELPIAAARERLFDVLAREENARLVWWMLAASKPDELAPLAATIRTICTIVADHPSFAEMPRAEVLREVAVAMQAAIALALGLGLMRAWIEPVFGAPPDDAALMAQLVGFERSKNHHVGEILTDGQ